MADFSKKIEDQRNFYEGNLRELKDFKSAKIAEENKRKKVDKKAKKKERKAELKALAKALNRVASHYSDSEPGLN